MLASTPLIASLAESARETCPVQVLVRLRPAQGLERDVGNVARLDKHTIRLRKECQVTGR